MAYPGTYDINYYKGDTFEFRIYPKDTSGSTFNLTGYLPPKFKISNIRGGTATITAAVGNGTTITYTAANSFAVGQTVTISGLGVASGTNLNISGAIIASVSPTQFTVTSTTVGIASGTGTATINGKVEIDGYATISTEGDYILCAITPDNGAAMTLGSYVYDVEIGKQSSPYNYVYTLLSGKISVTDQVNRDPLLAAPGSPSIAISTTVVGGITVDEVTNTTFKIDVTSGGGDAATEYNFYQASNVLDAENTKGTPTTVALPVSEKTYSGLSASNAYAFGVSAKNLAGTSAITWLYNYTAPGIPTSFAAGTATQTTIPLTWVAPAQSGTYLAPIAGYYIFLNGNPVPVKTVVAPASSTSLTGLTANTSYTISIAAFTSIVGTPFEALIDPDSRTGAVATITKSTLA